MSKAVSNEKSVGELLPCSAGDVSLPELAPFSDWRGMSGAEHFVQFYETDGFLLDSLSGFIGAGLSAGEAVIVVATQAHREGLEERLRANGLDARAAQASGQFIQLDAAELLSQFMFDGAPEAERFAEVVGGLITRVAEGRPRVRIFGEMVALLWAEGNRAAAISLEELWNKLHEQHPFWLFCAYPLQGFDGEGLAEPLGLVCSTHSNVVPAESYTALAEPEERLRAIIKLQQQARLLHAEIAERKEAEKALLAANDALEVQVEDLRRLHQMSVSLTSKLDIESVLEEVLRAAMDAQNASMGLLSLHHPEQDELKVKVHRGFAADFLKQIESVPPGLGACGTCYAQRRQVVVEDTEVDTVFAPYREAARAAGFRACHSTPLLARSDQIIGVLTVHFRKPHRPSERETRLMDLYARMAADFIENAQLHHRAQQELEERKQSLVREQMARVEAETANRMKDEFLATVSHELRTPLNAIIGWSHMLRHGRLDEATSARALETIERNAQSQAQLIEDILDVSRVITGKLSLNIGPVDLSSVINQAIDSVQLAADSKGIRLEVTLDPSARHTAGDAGRLQQVVWNLLSNAIKFTPAGGRVEVRLERADENVRIRVSDTGCGISADFLPFIFDRFRQADGTSTRRHGGLGLGLAIVRHLIELHGGTVQAASAGADNGCAFTIMLPLAKTNEPAKRSRSRRRLRANKTVDAPLKPLPSLACARVLLVDDDRDTLQMIALMLTEYGAEVHAVGSAAEALDALEWYKPDVLVSDLAMPDEDGYSLINKVRTQGEKNGKQIPAVALTAYVRVEDRTRALSAGFNMFVPKPVEPNELIAAISNLTEASAAELT